ncbi:MAG: hypothetical protein AB7K09_16395 [Planctomycetota bacterium]
MRPALLALVLLSSVLLLGGCTEPPLVEGPLDPQLIGAWTSIEPTGRTLTIDDAFALAWSETRTATFAPGSAGTPDAITLADGTALQASGATHENGSIDAGETFSTSPTADPLDLVFGATTAQLVGPLFTTHFSAWSESAGTLTLTASDTGTVTGTARTIHLTGMRAPMSTAFSITPAGGGSPAFIDTLGHNLTAQGSGSDLVTGAPWTLTVAAEDRTLTLDATAEWLRLTDAHQMPPGSPLPFHDSDATVRTWLHDYDSISVGGTLMLRHRSPGGDYRIIESAPGVRRLTLWNLSPGIADYTVVRALAGTSREITLDGIRWFRNGGPTTILGPWSDGADATVTFDATGTFELDPGNAQPLRHGHWRTTSGRIYTSFDEVYER